MLFTQCTQHNALLTSFPMQFLVFLSPSDGAPNLPHGRSHPPLLYIMIIHYFPPLGFPSRWLSLPLLPLCSWLWFPHKMESKSKLHSPSSEQVPFIRPPPNPGFPLLLSTLQWKASGSINRASRGWTSSHASFVSLSARAHTFFFTLAQSLMFSKVVVSFYSSPLTPPATAPPQ